MEASKSAVNDSVFEHSDEVNLDVDEGIEEEFEGKIGEVALCYNVSPLNLIIKFDLYEKNHTDY